VSAAKGRALREKNTRCEPLMSERVFFMLSPLSGVAVWIFCCKRARVANLSDMRGGMLARRRVPKIKETGAGQRPSVGRHERARGNRSPMYSLPCGPTYREKFNTLNHTWHFASSQHKAPIFSSPGSAPAVWCSISPSPPLHFRLASGTRKGHGGQTR